MSKRSLYRLFALLLAFTVVAAACGSSDDEADGEGTGEEATETEAGETDDDDSIAAGEEAEGDVDTEVEETEGERAYGGDIAVGLEAEAVGLRPWEDACASPCYNIMVTIYDKLVEQTVDGLYQGYLFETIEPNEDFTSWVGVLRSGVTFHNGAELTGQTIADMFPFQQEGSAGSSSVSASNLVVVFYYWEI